MNPDPIVLLLFAGIMCLIVEWDVRSCKSCIAETEGHVTAVSNNKGGLFVQCTYRVDGQIYFTGASISYRGYRSLTEAKTYLRGRTVTVHYNPTHPKRCWVDTSSL